MKLVSKIKDMRTGFKIMIVTAPINIIWLTTPYEIPFVIRMFNGLFSIIGIAYLLTENMQYGKVLK